MANGLRLGRPATHSVRHQTDERAELERAARILAIRSRREATGLFAGSYASAIRGGGMEFEESRPYVPGDDIRSIDWNALSRTGDPYVKCYREERGRHVVLAMDISASMAFGSTGRSLATVAARTACLLAAAAGRTGDRVGFMAFDEQIRVHLPTDAGAAHTWRVIREAAAQARRGGTGTDLMIAVEALAHRLHQHSVVFLLSDFRFTARHPQDKSPIRHLTTLTRRHDVVSVVLHDPRDEELPAVGKVRMRDPEDHGPGLLLDTRSAKVRRRYLELGRQRRLRVERELRAAGSDVLSLRADRDPMRALMHFFHQRAARHRVGVR